MAYLQKGQGNVYGIIKIPHLKFLEKIFERFVNNLFRVPTF